MPGAGVACWLGSLAGVQGERGSGGSATNEWAAGAGTSHTATHTTHHGRQRLEKQTRLPPGSTVGPSA